MRRGEMGLLGVVMLAVAGLDQWIKRLVETGMDLHERIDVLPFFALLRAHNTGIAFSFLSDFHGLGLIVLMLAVMAFVIWLAFRSDPAHRMARLGFALILGGALGNLIDRVALGYVIDYFLFHWGNWSFAIFNLADAAITVGAGLVILEEFVAWRRARAAGRS